MAALANRALSLRSQCILWSSVRPVLVAQKIEIGKEGRQPVRGFPTSKHWLLKWRLLRQKKVFNMELPSFVELKSEKGKKKELTPDEVRMDMKKKGQLPPRTFQELPLNISCTRAFMDPFKPPVGDGKHSSLLSSDLSDNISRLLKGPKTLKHLRKLKKYEEYNETQFAHDAQKIIFEAQTLLQDIYKNQERLHELVTEHAFPEMVHGLEHKTMVWSVVDTVEAPKVVHLRTEDMITADNVFSQITVRLHTKQILAIYDRFGRLMYGDPFLPKSVVEYVVMEKWISDTYGRWRIHGKILQDSASPRDNLIKTYKMPKFSPLPPSSLTKTEEKKDISPESGNKPGQPEFATA